MKDKNPFSSILNDGLRLDVVPQKTLASRKWYRTLAAASPLTERQLFADKTKLVSKVKMGDMVFFRYDAKGKADLPYWDAFPLIFPFAEDQNHFWGINLHAMPPTIRAKVMDALYTISSDKRYDENTKLRMNYDALRSLSNFNLVSPAVRCYLKSHVFSKFIKVDSREWDIALFLPVSNWHNASEGQVYRDYRRKVGR